MRSVRRGSVLIWMTASMLATAGAQTQKRIAGDAFVDFGKDQTGLTYYTSKGTLCVVHRPHCGLVGHNGKDHFFPAEKPLPAGVTLAGVQFKVFWPAGLTKTDRGGLGSKGSYGASGDAQIQPGPPRYSVHWENACEASTGADWSGLPLTYQISFVINVPNGVTVANAVDAQPGSGDVCNAADLPTPKPMPAAGASGWEGQVVFCNNSMAVVTEYLHIRATLLAVAAAGEQGSGAPMVEDNLPLQFSPGGVSGSSSGFRTAMKYEQGTWNITDVFLTTTQSSGTAIPKNAVHLSGLPAKAVLPGNIGSPVFNFTGGSCPAL